MSCWRQYCFWTSLAVCVPADACTVVGVSNVAAWYPCCCGVSLLLLNSVIFLLSLLLSSRLLPMFNRFELLLTSLVNVAGFSTAAAVIPDVNGVHAVVGLLACCCWLHYCRKHPCFWWRPYCSGGPVVAFIPAIACVHAIVVGPGHAIAVILAL